MSHTASIAERQGSLKAAPKQEEQAPEPSQVDWKNIWKPLALITGAFLLFFFLPTDNSRFTNSVIEALALAKWYAQEHVLLCLVPAFFIAGAIAVFVSQAAVMKYLGAGASKVIVLWRGQRVRIHSGGVLVHGAAAFCRHLETRGRAGAGHRLSILRPGHQRAGDHFDRPHPGARDSGWRGRWGPCCSAWSSGASCT